MPLQQPQHRAIVLFDGECSFCNGYVQFVFARDPEGKFSFAPLQSEPGRRLLRRYALPEGWLGSIVLIEDGRCFTHSAAVLRLCKGLKPWWPLLRVLVLIPRPLRDGIYRWVARNRYRWFGTTRACSLPTPELRRRFIADAF